MLRKGLFPRLTRLPLATVAVAAVFAMSAAASSPAYAADVTETSEFVIETDEPQIWPAFSDALNEQTPPLVTQPGWTPNNILTATSVVSAPLPQAVATGLFMLAGNWFALRLWKQRRI